MLKIIAEGLLGRVLGLGIFAGGFWLLIKGFVDSNIPLGVLGGIMIPLGMWVMAITRRVTSGRDDSEQPPARKQE
jgi:hypothetical protein